MEERKKKTYQPSSCWQYIISARGTSTECTGHILVHIVYVGYGRGYVSMWQMFRVTRSIYLLTYKKTDVTVNHWILLTHSATIGDMITVGEAAN